MSTIGDISLAVITPLKGAAWERAKGELRAFVHIAGSQYGSGSDHDEWGVLRDHVEAFIKGVDDKGWAE